MLKIKMIPILMTMAAKIDLKPVIERFKKLDVVKDGQKDFNDLDTEQKATVAFELIGAILPQIGKIADDIPKLIAIHKDIPMEDVKEMDAIEAIKEILADSGVMSFFKFALQKGLTPGT